MISKHKWYLYFKNVYKSDQYDLASQLYNSFKNPS